MNRIQYGFLQALQVMDGERGLVEYSQQSMYIVVYAYTVYYR